MFFIRRTVSMVVVALLLLCGAVYAELDRGSAVTSPFVGPTPDTPGLYVGIKDMEGTAVSWVRVAGVKDHGALMPSLRGIWGSGVVELPLIDIDTVEFSYSEGLIQADVHLLTGETMHMQLVDPNDELNGWWRQNNYHIPLASIRQAWFHYVPRGHGNLDRYTGPAVRLRDRGTVRSIDLQGRGGYLTVQTASGEILDLRFDYRSMVMGADLLGRKAPYMIGRPVNVQYTLSPGAEGLARRDLREIELRLTTP